MRRSLAIVPFVATCAVASLLAVPAFAKKRVDTLTVALKSSTGADAGTVVFTEKKKGLEVAVHLVNLPVGEHAVHIHALGVCDAPDFKGAGGHFNPDMKQHGLMNPMGHHNGDLPKNIVVGPDMKGSQTFTVNYLTLAEGGPNSILGHAVVVHEKADDMKTDPTGNAGNRIACAVIPTVTAP